MFVIYGDSIKKTLTYTKFKYRKQADPETKQVSSNIENSRIHTQAKIGVPIRKGTGTFRQNMDTGKENGHIHTQRTRRKNKRIQIPGGQNGQTQETHCKLVAKHPPREV